MRDIELFSHHSSDRKSIADCTLCGACREVCPFLHEYGMPGEILKKIQSGQMDGVPDPFECSLCGLCGSVCPDGLRPGEFFLDMRRARVEACELDLAPYGGLLGYEKMGDSSLFSMLRVPDGGDTALFPGCTLSGTRSDSVRKLFQTLQPVVPKIGIAMGCCLKPSHDLGRQKFFEEHFGRLHDKLRSAGIGRVITACPNCQKVFSCYGGGIEAVTAYELLVDNQFVPQERFQESAVVHDPCPLRHDTKSQDAVRVLAKACGVEIQEFARRGARTQCCGEGGSVGCIRPEFATQWTELRQKQAAGRKIVTSCAGCAGFLGRVADVDHILDLLVGNRGRTPVKSPFTYLARLRLKWWFRRNIKG